MFRFISKRKGALLLGGLVLLSFLWMTSQVRRPGSNPGLVERAVDIAAYPFVAGAHGAASSAGGLWHGYFALIDTAKDNRRLREENSRISLENLRLREAVARESRLSGLWGLREQAGLDAVAAAVVGRDASSWFRSAWINKGTSAGIYKNMPAMTYTGLVGKVVRTYAFDSRVMLLTDPSSAVSCLTERTRDQGILVGDGGDTCRMQYVGKHADVNVGDLILSSGLDGVYPKGLPVGDVVRVSKSSPGYFMDIEVRPTADIGQLEEVLLVKFTPPVEPHPEPAAPVRPEKAGAKKK